MSDHLDLSLEQLLEMQSGGAKSRGRSTGPMRRSQGSAPYGSRPRRSAPPSATGLKEDTGSKILVSHLGYNITEPELRELFGKIGELRKCQLFHDAQGKSIGTAQIVFAEKADGYRAAEAYHAVTLDGRPMKVEVAMVPRSALAMVQRASGDVTSRLGERGGSGDRRMGGRGGGDRRSGRRHGFEEDTTPKATFQELDAQMDDYATADAGMAQGGGVQDDVGVKLGGLF